MGWIKKFLTVYSDAHIMTQSVKKLYLHKRNDTDCLTGCQQKRSLEAMDTLRRTDAAPIKIITTINRKAVFVATMSSRTIKL